ncbi:MAG: LCP family protein [Chloroflexota bacterium]
MGDRTDVIMLMTLNPAAGTISLTSFPRAMYVYAPAWTMMPLHTVQPRGGYRLLLDTFEYNFGVRPDHYINISMKNFEYVVDAIGGVDVQVTEYLSDPTYAGGKFSVSPGLVHMDGRMARWYARSRMTTSDFARAHRQQALMKAIFIKMIQIDAISRAPELYESFIDNVDTDLTLADLMPHIPLALQIVDTSRVSQYTIDLNHVALWITPRDGAQVFLPDRDALYQLLSLALSP